MSFIETRMSLVAPNLTVMLSSGPAARLMAAAGGLSALSKMPACNVQVRWYCYWHYQCVSFSLLLLSSWSSLAVLLSLFCVLLLLFRSFLPFSVCHRCSGK